MFDLPDIDIQHVWTFAAGHVLFCLHFVLLHIGTFLEPIMPPSNQVCNYWENLKREWLLWKVIFKSMWEISHFFQLFELLLAYSISLQEECVQYISPQFSLTLLWKC